MNKLLVVAASLVIAACDQGRSFLFPTTATPTTATVPAPPPAPRPSLEVTSIRVGDLVSQTIGDSPPECTGLPGWPCQYFGFTASRNGTVAIELRYDTATQPPGKVGPQGVDISLASPQGEPWADFSDLTTTRLTTRLTEGTDYVITLWYTFPRLQYTLQTRYTD